MLVLPALFAGDLYVYPMRSWLRRQGHKVVPSTLIMNAGCPERLCRTVETVLQRRMTQETERVALIGHSRGGFLARAIAARLQDEASHLILLGSPIGVLAETRSEIDPGLTPARVLLAASARARHLLDPDCNVPACGCPFPEDFRRPLSAQTKVVSIYSRDDPIVPPSASLVAGARNVEVHGTHSGLVYNREVYEELAVSLA
ncbi:MAG: hypothetical protein IIA23_01135 [Chloroflexi bacterium]|nr:hypothetical protein [Chloroflexota bacterium]